MRNTKFVVIAAAAIGIAGTFMTWVRFDLKDTAVAGLALPVSGMDNGGPIFLFFLALAALFAIIGVKRAFGRGLAIGALVGGFIALAFALVKHADISEAAREIKALGTTADVGTAAGFWLTTVGALAVTAAAVVALIRPERRAA